MTNPLTEVKIGARVKALKVLDPYADIVVGTKGTVVFIDDFDTIHVHWDDGRRLGLIPEIDEFEIIHEDEIVAHQTHTL